MLLEHVVEESNIWRMCQTLNTPIQDIDIETMKPVDVAEYLGERLA